MLHNLATKRALNFGPSVSVAILRDARKSALLRMRLHVVNEQDSFRGSRDDVICLSRAVRFADFASYNLTIAIVTMGEFIVAAIRLAVLVAATAIAGLPAARGAE